MSAKKQPNEKQTELDFSTDGSKLATEIHRLRNNLTKYIRRGDHELAIKTGSELNQMLVKSVSADSVGNKSSVSAEFASAKRRIEEFYSRTPRPTLLEQAVYLTAESQKWNGSRCDFNRMVIKPSGHSVSSIYRLLLAGSRLTGEAIAVLSTHELANKNVHLLDKIAHLPEAEQSNKRKLDRILKASRRGRNETRTPVIQEPVIPRPIANPNEESARILLREDYHKIARIFGAQNQALYLKLKEVISNNHKGDLQTQVDIVATLGHILKELKSINQILINSSVPKKLDMSATKTFGETTCTPGDQP